MPNKFSAGRAFVAALLSVSAIAIASSANAATYNWLTARGGDSGTVKAVQQAAAMYKQTHPEFDLTVEPVPDRPAYLQKVKILATSGELPDLFDADAEPYFADIVANNLVANVGSILDEIGVTDKFYKFSLDYERLDDGSLYLIPFESNTEYFWYHPSMLEKAGVELPATLDDLLAACGKLKAAGITPVSVDGKDGWPIYRYLSFPAFRETGNQFLEDLKAGKVSMNSEVGLASSKYLQDMGSTCFQEGFSTANYTAALDLFTSGQAAIYYMGTWEIGTMTKEDGTLKDDVAYFTLPVIDGKSATKPTDFYAHSGIGTAIKAGSDTPELKDFLKFLVENFADIALYDQKFMPSIKPTIRPELAEIYKSALADIEKVETYVKVWDVKLDANTVDVLFRQTQLLALGQITPEQFGTEIDNSIQQYVASR
jgi:raffinose/stachyose/melibiose transport system substrate-binding protein